MRWFKRKREGCVSPYRHIYDMLDSNDPETQKRGAELIMSIGPVPGSFGDNNSYGAGPCGHMGPYPGCPKCKGRYRVMTGRDR